MCIGASQDEFSSYEWAISLPSLGVKQEEIKNYCDYIMLFPPTKMLWLLNAMSAKLMIAEFQVQVENPVCNYALRQIAKRDEILHVVSYPNIYL